VASLIGASPNEMVFTSGATESNNLFLRGFPYETDKNRVLISAAEHDSVTRVAEELHASGKIELTVVPLQASGEINADAFERLLDHRVAVVSVVAANSETGIVNPLAELVDKAHRVGAVMHSDATQIAGRLPLNFAHLRLDAASLSAHKMNGPQGVGAFFAKRALMRRLQPTAVGGGHENGLRAGTYNVAGIVGMGVAATLAAQPADAARTRHLRDLLEQQLLQIPNITIHGRKGCRLPNTTNIWFEQAPGDAVLCRTPEIAASLGSACHAGALTPSPTLLAMGLDREIAAGSIRFSITRFTTAPEIERAAELIATAVAELRELQREVA
jgi:cysteine desulfurase